MSYSDYLDTHYSSCGMDDYAADKRLEEVANSSYDEGFELFREGKLKEADDCYKKALEAANSLGLGKKEYPPYKDVMDEIRRDSARRDPEDRHWENLSTHNERFSND